MDEYIARVTEYGRGQRQVSLTAFNDPDDSNASSGNALYPTVELDGYCWRGERR